MLQRKKLSIEETDAYLKSQEPVYRIHQLGKQLATEPTPAAASPDPTPCVKLRESKITGKVEKPFSSDELSLPNERRPRSRTLPYYA